MYRDPLLLEDGSVIVHGHTPLLRIDKCNNVKWVIDKLFHHSIELTTITLFGLVPVKFQEIINFCMKIIGMIK